MPGAFVGNGHLNGAILFLDTNPNGSPTLGQQALNLFRFRVLHGHEHYLVNRTTVIADFKNEVDADETARYAFQADFKRGDLCKLLHVKDVLNSSGGP